MLDSSGSLLPPDKEETLPYGFSSFNDLIELYSSSPDLSCRLPEARFNVSTDLPEKKITLHGNQLFGEVTFLAQVHFPPIVDSGEYQNFYIGLAQARIYLELEKGQYAAVFPEAEYLGFDAESTWHQTRGAKIVNEFKSLFFQGISSETITKEQLSIFMKYSAWEVYVALNPHVEVMATENLYAHQLALGIVSSQDFSPETKAKVVFSIRDALITDNLCKYFEKPNNRGEKVALILGAMHEMTDSNELSLLLGSESSKEIPLIEKHTFVHDVWRSLSLDIDLWSDGIESVGKENEFKEVLLRPVVNFLV
jgi:hypothetical protein